jgi:hypothetical protein
MLLDNLQVVLCVIALLRPEKKSRDDDNEFCHLILIPQTKNPIPGNRAAGLSSVLT